MQIAERKWSILTGKTHAAAGAATALLIGTNLPQLALVVAGSLLPDIDHSGSMLGKHIKPISRRLKHRHLTHSLLFLLAAHIISPYLGIGVFTHIFLDMLNPQGVKLFYPNKKSIRFPIFHSFTKTGGPVESFIFYVLMIVIVFTLIFYQNLWGYTNLIEIKSLWYDLDLPSKITNFFKGIKV